ncbi:MAG: glycosyltransferase, partial [Helicobacter sp.]|nr:glycosyltransferase [Helicobacter sp.]
RKDAKYFEAHAPNLPNLFYYEIASSEIHHYLYASDVVVSYSQSDGLSQSLLEAVAARRLVVANDLPQHREILHNGYNAVLFENEADLPNALEKAQQLCTKPIVLDKNVDYVLNVQSQKNYYLQILKEAFDV